MDASASRELDVTTPDGTSLSAEANGAGTPVVLLHGLTATRRYVLMGSRTLERSGHLVVSYDARGHGRSGVPSERRAYGYEHLAGDLESVLDAFDVDRAVLTGASMGAHTVVRLALASPERVAGLVLITPAFDADGGDQEAELSRWDALADGLEGGGVEGFVHAYELCAVPELWRETVEKVIRQRLAAHAHPDVLADALRVVPRSRPFESMAQLAEISVPTVVVASRDEADPGHPLAVGEQYVQAIPGAQLRVEEPGSSPLAWQGGRLSRIVAELARHT